mmetsp:Transcript_8643/g.30521  ORF Transcript_8643/g.30521 Transcript_8643/m.30521 type:complete len:268 (+) Transcript_8643:1385-2188(+)
MAIFFLAFLALVALAPLSFWPVSFSPPPSSSLPLPKSMPGSSSSAGAEAGRLAPFFGSSAGRARHLDWSWSSWACLSRALAALISLAAATAASAASSRTVRSERTRASCARCASRRRSVFASRSLSRSTNPGACFKAPSQRSARAEMRFNCSSAFSSSDCSPSHANTRPACFSESSTSSARADRCFCAAKAPSSEMTAPCDRSDTSHGFRCTADDSACLAPEKSRAPCFARASHAWTCARLPWARGGAAEKAPWPFFAKTVDRETFA